MTLNRRHLLGAIVPLLTAPCLAAAGPDESDAVALRPSSGRNWYDEPRALAFTYVPIDVLFDLSKGARLEVEWTPLPEDATVVSAYLTAWAVTLVVESKTFGWVEPGAYVPFIGGDEVSFKKVPRLRHRAGSKR